MAYSVTPPLGRLPKRPQIAFALTHGIRCYAIPTSLAALTFAVMHAESWEKALGLRSCESEKNDRCDSTGMSEDPVRHGYTGRIDR